MRSSSLFQLLLMSSVLAGASSIAHAQYDGQGSSEAPIVLSNDPKAMTTPVPVANHSGWVVQAANIPAQYRPDGQPQPCVAMRQVGNNGEQLKFSGGGGKLTGVAVEAAGLNLAEKSAISAVIELDQARVPVSVTGYVASPTTVVINTMKYPDLYTIVAASKRMRIQFGAGPNAPQRSYDLNGVQTALKDMDACFTQGNLKTDAKPTTQAAQAQTIEPIIKDAASSQAQWATPAQPAAAPKASSTVAMAPTPSLEISNEPFLPNVAPMVETTLPVAPQPLAERDIAPIKPVQPVQPKNPVITVTDANPPPAPVAAAAPVPQGKIVDSFRARKGESLRDVMRRWAQRAGIDIVWTLQSDVTLEHDYSFVGSFEESLNKLLADYPDSGIKTTMAQPAADISPKPYVEELSPPAVPPIAVQGEDLSDFVPTMPDLPAARMPDQSLLTPVVAAPPEAVSTPPATQVAFGPTKRWRALQGASMREVLQAWADDADVKLIWRVPQDYVVRNSVNVTTDYAKAVNHLLEQYMYQPGRPTGQIYQDPATGAKSLVITPAQG